MNEKLRLKVLNTDFQKLFKSKGYVYFTNGGYNLNIIGIRSSEHKDNNTFDDIILVDYKNNSGVEFKFIHAITTNPGVKSLKNPINSKGCAILVPGQYRGCWTIGYHKGTYRALVQCKPVKVYRDKNKDNILDMSDDDIDEGIFGINIHKAGKDSKIVDNWSAGCQVFANEDDFNTFMELCDNQIRNGKGKTFTYTLIDEKDLD